MESSQSVCSILNNQLMEGQVMRLLVPMLVETQEMEA
jgi:hypothetical protein